MSKVTITPEEARAIKTAIIEAKATRPATTPVRKRQELLLNRVRKLTWKGGDLQISLRGGYDQFFIWHSLHLIGSEYAKLWDDYNFTFKERAR